MVRPATAAGTTPKRCRLRVEAGGETAALDEMARASRALTFLNATQPRSFTVQSYPSRLCMCGVFYNVLNTLLTSSSMRRVAGRLPQLGAIAQRSSAQPAAIVPPSALQDGALYSTVSVDCMQTQREHWQGG